MDDRLRILPKKHEPIDCKSSKKISDKKISPYDPNYAFVLKIVCIY